MQLLDGLLQDIPSLILARHPWFAPRCSPQISLPVKSGSTIRSRDILQEPCGSRASRASTIFNLRGKTKILNLGDKSTQEHHYNPTLIKWTLGHPPSVAEVRGAAAGESPPRPSVKSYRTAA